MGKSLFLAFSAVVLLTGCAQEYNRVFKSSDFSYKYEYAKQSFAEGKYSRASMLLHDLINMQKGKETAQECLFLLALSEYNCKNYEAGAEAFKKYCSSYPKGKYAEMASYYVGQSLYEGVPEPRLDQSQTLSAISAFQEYLDLYPDAEKKWVAHQRLFDLQSVLVKKELGAAQLYYDLGSYFGNCTNGGNNYEACIITAQNALKDYPYTDMRENFSLLIMKSKFELAQQSVEEKKLERFQDAEDECYGFINEYPESKDKAMAERFIEKCKEYTKNIK